MDSGKRTKEQVFKEIASALSALEDKKAEHIRVLDVRGKSSITDFMILANGTSEPHLKALKRALDESLREVGARLIGQERETGSGWLVADAFDFMVHLQTQPMREFYGLDALWKDAPEISLKQIVA